MKLFDRYQTLADESFTEEVVLGDAEVEVARTPEPLEDQPRRSPITHVSDAAWEHFCNLMVQAPSDAVSPANNLGMYELTPRRLEDLGIVKRLTRARHPKSGRTVWVADFIEPYSAERLLASPQLQYLCFACSMLDYAERMKKGALVRPKKMSLAGALAILHRMGPRGFESWARGPRLPETEALFTRVEGVF